MKKKRLAAAALVSCITLSATFAGCSLITVNSNADTQQVIATVDIRKSDNFDAYFASPSYKQAISETDIVKRDLVSYFLNVGYSYINNNMTYEETFNLLLDALIDNAVLVQYSTLALLKDKAGESGDAASVVAEYNALGTQVKKYEYLLGGENSDEVKLAQYRWYSSLNSAIDNYEKTIIDEETEYSGSASRTTPTNLKTEQDDYYPGREDGKLNYFIYTGYTGYLLSDSGAYEEDALDGTTRATRKKAYNTFINNLNNNDLIENKEGENLTDILTLDYIQGEYESQLESRIINKYNEIYEDKQEQELLKDDYIQNLYEELLNSQKEDYKTSSAFESAMGNMSSSTFFLYSPDTSDSDLFDGEHNGSFGYVYNILLPFSAKQSAKLSELKSVLEQDGKDDDYYYGRNQILKNIETEDQRSAWFNGSEDYSFVADKNVVYNGDKAGYFGHGNEVEYLFFEDNLTDSAEGGRYKKLEAYDGRYAYNGQVYENEDGSYTLIGERFGIDGMLKEFSEYINYVLGADNRVSFNETAEERADYYNTTVFTKEGIKDEIDYSKFIYSSGKVNFGTFNRNDLMNATTEQYKAMSAVNELQFAYTTDTSVLSQYIGYTVSAYDTSYIKEFEYAAKKAISEGAGSFAVCAGDYGWHLIYVTFTFGNDETYSPDWSKIKDEGTFENLFFESLKDKDLSNVTSTHRSKLISDFNKEDETVTKYTKRYQDLLELDKD